MLVRGTWRIGRIAGIEIAIHPSWLVIYALFAWSATAVASPALGRFAVIELGLVYSLLLFASVVVHELSHAIVARRQGIPIGNITLFLFGGVASIKREPGTPGDELRMAAAGPAASVALGILFAAIAWPLPERWVWANDLFWFLSISNVALAVFNLLPAFPSDGGRILRAFLWRWLGSQARATGNAGIVSLVVAGLLIAGGTYLAFNGRSIGGSDAPGVANITVKGWWWILIGIFLSQAALASMRGARSSLILERMPVGECMARTLIPVPASTSIAGFVSEMAVNGRRAGYPVVSDGALLGLVTLQDTSAVPHTLWQQTPVTAVMTPSSRAPGVPPAMPACDALAVLDEHHVGELPVFEGGALTGVVSKETIYAALHDRERAVRA
jgi:Zn-dependent protease